MWVRVFARVRACGRVCGENVWSVVVGFIVDELQILDFWKGTWLWRVI